MSSYLITGVAGFIGSGIARELLNRGDYVRGIDNFDTGNAENLDGLLDDNLFELVEGDIRDQDDVKRSVEGMDYVFHQAAVTSVPQSIDTPSLTTETNCLGTTNVLEASRNQKAKKVVVASSSAVYGSGGDLPKREDMKINPESPYALSKYWTEEIAMQYNRYHDLDTVALRYFNVYGPRQNPEGDYAAVIPKFINLILAGQPPVIYGDGEQSRDFVYIDDVVDANLRAVDRDCSGEVLNVGSNRQVTVNALVDELNSIFDTEIEPVYDEPRPGDIRHSYADISKANEHIGFEPSVEFRQGLEETVEHFREELVD